MPWAITESATEHTRQTLDDIAGQGYFSPCYVPFTELEHHFERFVRTSESARSLKATGQARYLNGFVLVGCAGSGKTAFLARQVESLIARDNTAVSCENRNIVLFQHGSRIALRPEGISLLRDLAEKLGVAVASVEVRDDPKVSARGGLSSFAELLSHLHGLRKQDRVEGRRLVLVLDALNEAPLAEKVIAEALELIAAAAFFPWCKVVISLRQEWLSSWSDKGDTPAMKPLEVLRPWLYDTQSVHGEWTRRPEGPPVVMMDPFTEAQAADVYRRHQTAANRPTANNGRLIRASTTPWEQLPHATRELLTNPLNLHLFMEAFDGRPAEALTAINVLFHSYVDRVMADHPRLGVSLEEALAHLLEDLSLRSATLGKDDADALQRQHQDSPSAKVAQIGPRPLDTMAQRGLIGCGPIL